MASAPRYAIAALSYARAASSSTSKMPRYLYFLLAYCPSLASQRPLLRFFVTPRYLELPRVKQQLWRRMYDTSWARASVTERQPRRRHLVSAPVVAAKSMTACTADETSA